jgi:O-antigen ligase
VTRPEQGETNADTDERIGFGRRMMRRMANTAREWAGLLSVLMLIAIVLGWFGGAYGLFDLAAHFQFQYVIASLVFIVLLGFMRSRWILVPILCLLLSAPRLGPYWLRRRAMKRWRRIVRRASCSPTC